MILAEVTFDLSNIDPFAIITAVVGYIVVFTALLLLYFIYKNLPLITNMKIRQRLRREGKHQHAEEGLSITGEESAAIAMAIYMHFEKAHDEESNVVTIKKVSKRYSPWSSKLYGLNTYRK